MPDRPSPVASFLLGAVPGVLLGLVILLIAQDPLAGLWIFALGLAGGILGVVRRAVRPPPGGKPPSVLRRIGLGAAIGAVVGAGAGGVFLALGAGVGLVPVLGAAGAALGAVFAAPIQMPRV